MNAVRPWLFIGKYRETLDEMYLLAQGFGAVLQLAEEISYTRLAWLYVVVDDGVPLPGHLLRQGIDFVLEQHRLGRTILIACGAGMSRSASFAVAALKEVEHLSLTEALQTVKQHHPDTLPHPALWESLCTYYQEDVLYERVLAILTEG